MSPAGVSPSAAAILTRPARESRRWAQALADLGIRCIELPLISIEPVQDMAMLEEVRARAGQYQALMFVSAPAVEHFFGSATEPGDEPRAAALSLPQGVRCWATGPGTARALRHAGVAPQAIDMPVEDEARFDSEALWLRVRGQLQPGARVLIVRGGDAQALPTGRDWLAQQIAGTGAVCDTVVAYRRLAPRWTDARKQLAAEATAHGATWVFSSSEAVQHLQDLMRHQDWRQAHAVATHERIAQAARALGFEAVRVVPPTISAVAASIESGR